eukprot:947225_1
MSNSAEPLKANEHDHDDTTGRVLNIQNTSPDDNDASIETNANANNDRSLLYLLLWKNMKFVGTKLFIGQLLCPWILLIIVGVASYASATYNVNCSDRSGDDCPDIFYQPSNSMTHDATDIPSYSGYMLASKLCPHPDSYPGYLAFTPHPSSLDDPSLYLQFIQSLSQNTAFPPLNTTCNTILNSLNFTEDSLLKFFDSRDDFVEHINA